jgi:hypothetical protein
MQIFSSGVYLRLVIRLAYLMKLLVSSVLDSASAMALVEPSNTSFSFPRYYFNWLRKACQAAKVSINLSPESESFLLVI